MTKLKPIHIAYLVALAGICVALHVTKFSPALPVLSEEFEFTSVQAGFLLSLIQLAGMCFGLLAGAMTELIGHKRGILIGMSILLITTVLEVFAQSVSFLLVMRACEGAGFLLAVMPAPAMIRQLVAAHDLPRMMALWSAFMPFGAAASLFFGSIVIVFLSWQVWWWLLAVVTFILLCLLYKILPDDSSVKEEGRDVQTFYEKLQSAIAVFLSRLTQTLKSSGSWYVAIGFCMYSAQWLTVVGFLPTIFVQLGVTGIAVGLVAGLIAGVNVIGNLASGRLIGKGVSPSLIVGVSFIIMGACAVLAFATLGLTDVWIAGARLLAIFVFSAIGGAIPGTLFYLSTQVAPNQSCISTTVGLAQQFSSTGQFLAPPVVGALVDFNQGDWRWTWVFLLGCCLVGLVIAKQISTFLSMRKKAV